MATAASTSTRLPHPSQQQQQQQQQQGSRQQQQAPALPPLPYHGDPSPVAAVHAAAAAQGFVDPPPPTLAQRDAQFAQAVRNAAASGVREWSALLHLAPLASQYHLSPYSIIKYGPAGSPFPYIPLTLQQPQLVLDTMAKQRHAERTQQLLRQQNHNAQAERNWHDASAAGDGTVPASDASAANGVVGAQEGGIPTASQDDATLANAHAHAQATGNPPVKTSDSHPINISTLIPPHLISVISDSIFATPSSSDGPTTTTSSSHREQDKSFASTPTTGRQDLSQSEPSTTQQGSMPGQRLAKRQSSRTPLAPNGVSVPSSDASNDGGEAEMEDAVEEDGIGLGEKRKRSLSRVDASVIPASAGVSTASRTATPNGLPVMASSSTDSNPATSVDSASIDAKRQGPDQDEPSLASKDVADGSAQDDGNVNGTHFVRLSCDFDLAHAVCDQPELHNVPAPPEAPHPVIAAQAATRQGATEVCTDPERAVEAAKQAVASAKASERGVWAPPGPEAWLTDPYSAASAAAAASDPTLPSIPAQPLSATSTSNTREPERRRIGNLLLSSCPGKKVRLTGPVRGRGAICRSLPSDLGRMRALGIRAIVCCLDDDELAFLGAPWREYERVAREAQLDVVRIPIAEGFAPSSVRELDERVREVIARWSLQGCDVLVHCRGGVGRAGLFACAWMLKMGLVKDRGGPASSSGSGPGSGSRSRSAGPGRDGRAATPQRVKNGTATPAASTSPLFDAADEGDMDAAGIPVPPPGLLLTDPKDLQDAPDSPTSINEARDRAGTVANGVASDARDGLEAGPGASAEAEAPADVDLDAEERSRGRNAVPSLKTISGDVTDLSLSGSPTTAKAKARLGADAEADAGPGADNSAGTNANADAPSTSPSSSSTPSTLTERERALLSRQDRVLRTVERLIRTIRTRRSSKAIETAEQVKFLVDYVTYLEDAEESSQLATERSAPATAMELS